MGKISRRQFIAASGAIAGAAMVSPIANLSAESIRDSERAESKNADGKKLRLAMIGTGIRGITMWGRDLVTTYSDYIQFVGLCDKNEGRVNFAKTFIGANCPVYTDFEKMMKETKPDVLIVTTMDSTHHLFITRGMELGADIITEKPLTTDETKLQAIIDAEKKTGRKCRVTFNYRYSPHRAKIWEILRFQLNRVLTFFTGSNLQVLNPTNRILELDQQLLMISGRIIHYRKANIIYVFMLCGPVRTWHQFLKFTTTSLIKMILF